MATVAAACGAVIAVVLGGATTAPAFADPLADADAPRLVSISRSVDELSASGGPVAVEIRVSDGGSGVDGSFDMWFSQGPRSTDHVSAVLSTGDLHDGLWSATVVLPADGPGVWSLQVGPITDAAGNAHVESASIDGQAVRVGFPRPPSTVHAAATGVGHELRLTWPAADDGGRPITRYTVLNSRGDVVASTDAQYRSAVIDLDWNRDRVGDGTYRVGSTNATGWSGPSPASARTPTPAAPSGPVRAVRVLREDRSALVTWMEPEDAFTAAATSVVATAQPGGSSCRSAARQCTIPDLDPDEYYTFSAVSLNAVGTSSPAGPSNPLTEIMPLYDPAPPFDVQTYRKPSAPSDPKAGFSADGSTVGLTWGASSVALNETVRYTVTSTPSAGTCRTTETSCSFPGLTPGTTYTFTIAPWTSRAGPGTARDIRVTPYGVPGAPQGVSVTPYGVPGPPQRLTVSTKGSKVSISWSPSAANGAEIRGYSLTLRSQAGEVRTVDLPAEARSFTSTDLRPAVGWTGSLTAMNRAGPSAASTTARFTLFDPKVRPARAAKPLASHVGARSLRVRWAAVSPRTGAAIDRYQLVVRRGSVVVSRRTLSTGDRSVTVRTLRPSTAYRLEVRAHSAAGWGEVSKPMTVRTDRR